MSLDVDPPPMPVPSVSEAVVLDQVATHAGESSGHHHGPIHTHCENCGTKLAGPFCHACGQQDFEFHRSFGHVFLEVLENFFHFDAKLFRNIHTLLFRPGQLSAEFNAGKRAAQMPPFRLYLFVSVLFFFSQFLGHGGEEKPPMNVNFKPTAENSQAMADAMQRVADKTTDPEKRAEIQRAVDELRATPAKTADKEPDADRVAKTVRNSPNIDVGNRIANSWLKEKIIFSITHQEEIGREFFHAVPKLLLFCLPLFALYTRILYRKAGYVYLQHLVVALHAHTFYYLWSLFTKGWVALVALGLPKMAQVLDALAGIWTVLYLLFMLRRLFQQSWGWTIFKAALLFVTYFFTLGVGMLVTVILVVALA